MDTQPNKTILLKAMKDGRLERETTLAQIDDQTLSVYNHYRMHLPAIRRWLEKKRNSSQ